MEMRDSMFALAEIHLDDNSVETGDYWHGSISFALIIIHAINPMDSLHDKTCYPPIFHLWTLTSKSNFGCENGGMSARAGGPEVVSSRGKKQGY